jgi:hypothetical protein
MTSEDLAVIRAAIHRAWRTIPKVKAPKRKRVYTPEQTARRKAWVKEWRKKNPERIRAYARAAYQRHVVHCLAHEQEIQNANLSAQSK